MTTKDEIIEAINKLWDDTSVDQTTAWSRMCDIRDACQTNMDALSEAEQND